MRPRARLPVEVTRGVEASPAMPLRPKVTDFFGPNACIAHDTTYTENRQVFSLTGRALSFYMFCSLSSAGFSGI